MSTDVDLDRYFSINQIFLICSVFHNLEPIHLIFPASCQMFKPQINQEWDKQKTLKAKSSRSFNQSIFEDVFSIAVKLLVNKDKILFLFLS